MRLTLLLLPFLFYAGCTSTPTAAAKKLQHFHDVSDEITWRLKSVDINTKYIKGKCNLSPGQYIRRSSLYPQSTLIAALNVDGCNMVAGTTAPSTTSAMFSAFYSPYPSRKFKLTIHIGDLDYAENEKEGEALTAQGYRDIHMTSKGVFKMKETVNADVNGTCEKPVLSGLYGFRKQLLRCNLQGNGTVELTEE